MSGEEANGAGAKDPWGEGGSAPWEVVVSGEEANKEGVSGEGSAPWEEEVSGEEANGAGAKNPWGEGGSVVV